MNQLALPLIIQSDALPMVIDNTHPSELPLVSVITVVRNGAAYIRNAIESVLHQEYPRIEYIIVDGDSTDETIDIVRSYGTAIDQWISEPDQGIYDAMNKGISMARGSIINLLNSDDYMLDGCIATVVKHYLSLPPYKRNTTILYGTLVYCDRQGGLLPITQPRQVKTNWFWKRDMPGHPTWFVPSMVYRTVGLYNLRFKIVADQDFYLRARQAGIKFQDTGHRLAAFRLGGAHNSPKTAFECYHVYKKHYGIIRSMVALLYDLPARIAGQLLPNFIPSQKVDKLRNVYYKLKNAQN